MPEVFSLLCPVTDEIEFSTLNSISISVTLSIILMNDFFVLFRLNLYINLYEEKVNHGKTDMNCKLFYIEEEIVLNK